MFAPGRNRVTGHNTEMISMAKISPANAIWYIPAPAAMPIELVILRLAAVVRLNRPRIVRHRIECYAASAAGESWFCRTAAGVWNPCRSMSQAVL